jgi:hypothetical protein
MPWCGAPAYACRAADTAVEEAQHPQHFIPPAAAASFAVMVTAHEQTNKKRHSTQPHLLGPAPDAICPVDQLLLQPTAQIVQGTPTGRCQSL